METHVLKLMFAKLVNAVEKTLSLALPLTSVTRLVSAILILEYARTPTNLMDQLVTMAMLVPRPMFAKLVNAVEKTPLFALPLTNVTTLEPVILQLANVLTPTNLMVPLVLMATLVRRPMFAELVNAVEKTPLFALLLTNVTKLVFATLQLENARILKNLMALLVTMEMLVPGAMFVKTANAAEKALLFAMPLTNVTRLVSATRQLENARTLTKLMALLVTIMITVRKPTSVPMVSAWVLDKGVAELVVDDAVLA